MVKSLLLSDRHGRYVMACVNGDARLDVHAVRACLSEEWKRLHFADAAEIAAVTGYPQGAVNPIGLPANVPVIMDVAVAACTRVNISRGDPLAGLELDPRDLIHVTGARIAVIAAAE
jgi:prolyl-tRNA editing enzyme YbaK/EbsC (Cys-tRNA(Pro) deacylase)